MTAMAEHEELEEGFSLSVLDTGSGAKMADKIPLRPAGAFSAEKIFSSIFLTGKGFCENRLGAGIHETDLQQEKSLCGDGSFAKGAAMKAEEYLTESDSPSFVCLCEGKLWSTVSMEVMKRDAKSELVLASAGERAGMRREVWSK